MTSAPKTSPRKTGSTETELDESSLSAIRSILTEEAAPAPHSRFSRVRPAEPVAGAAPTRRKADALPDLLHATGAEPAMVQKSQRKRGLSFGRKTAQSKARAVEPTVENAPVQRSRPDEDSLIMRLRAYRPSIVHMILAAFVLLVLLRPWLVLGLMVFWILIMIGVLLIAGYDGFWHGVVKASRWYASRRPSRANALHAKLDCFAVRWDAILDRFPEGTVDGLYLPDFTELATADARHDEALERRLAGLQEKGAGAR